MNPRSIILLLVTLLFSQVILGQTDYITTTWSANKKFYIKCIPYDDMQASLKGIAFVYNKHNKLIYKINCGFNSVGEYASYIALSNDGNTVAYIMRDWNNNALDSLRSISIFRKGKMVKGFTQMEITGCNPEKDKCTLTYYNIDRVIDEGRSQLFPKSFHKVYKDNITPEEIFLCDHVIAQINDRIYITDPAKKVHVIDMDKADTIGTIAFANIYPELKSHLSDSLTAWQEFETPNSRTKSSFPNLINGDTTSEVLAKVLGLKTVYLGPDFGKYRQYWINIEAYISRDGTIDIQKMDIDKDLPKDTIVAFFKSHRYDRNFMPVGIDKWYFRYFFCSFRNKSDKQALLEKQQQDSLKLVERHRRMTLDTINGVYIPRNLQECFIGLDKLLSDADKKEMMALTNANGMMMYHSNLGMWIRNNWGLWGGSRLITYFKSYGLRGINFKGQENDPDPDHLSSIILFSYCQWLKGDKNAAKEWEDNAAANLKH